MAKECIGSSASLRRPVAWWLLGLAALSCTPNPAAPSPASAAANSAATRSAAPASTQASAGAANPPQAQPTGSGGGGSAPQVPVPRGIADDASLTAGLVRFSGMLRPTKGGLKLRGVTFSLEALSQALASAGQSAVGYDDLLGDRVSVVAELEQVGGAAKREPERAAVQRRSGVYFVARELVSATLEAEAEQIEGVVARSKGFFSVSQHLVSRDDLNWALPGGKDAAGERVRLWGQPRTVHCHPEAQCLLGGSLPMFDVARAERVP